MSLDSSFKSMDLVVFNVMSVSYCNVPCFVIWCIYTLQCPHCFPFPPSLHASSFLLHFIYVLSALCLSCRYCMFHLGSRRNIISSHRTPYMVVMMNKALLEIYRRPEWPFITIEMEIQQFSLEFLFLKLYRHQEWSSDDSNSKAISHLVNHLLLADIQLVPVYSSLFYVDVCQLDVVSYVV